MTDARGGVGGLKELLELGDGGVGDADGGLEAFRDGHAAGEELEGVDLGTEGVDLARGEKGKRGEGGGEGAIVGGGIEGEIGLILGHW